VSVCLWGIDGARADRQFCSHRPDFMTHQEVREYSSSGRHSSTLRMNDSYLPSILGRCGLWWAPSRQVRWLPA